VSDEPTNMQAELDRMRADMARTVRGLQERIVAQERRIASMALDVEGKVGPDELASEASGKAWDECLRNDGSGTQGPPGEPGETFTHRWQFEMPDEANPLKLYVGPGVWIRNYGKIVHHGGYTTDNCGSEAGLYYVYVLLKRNGSSPATYHPGLYPDGYEIKYAPILAEGVHPDNPATALENDYPQHADRPAGVDGNCDGPKNTVRVLGTVTVSAGAITSFDQWVYEDIDDRAVIPDADNNAGSGPRRSTLETNWAEAEDAYLSPQLYDVDSVPFKEKAIPVFVDSRTTDDGKAAQGSLKWVPPDCEVNGEHPRSGQKSIEVKLPGGGRNYLQLSNWDDAEGQTELDTGDYLLLRRIVSGDKATLVYLTVTTVEVLKAGSLTISGGKLKGKKVTVLCIADTESDVDLIDLYTCPEPE
jgi:hypothetical protein